MGVMLIQGRGHPRNPYNDKLAVHYLTIAVQEGIKDAAAALAFMNFKGRGIKENHLDALHLYMLSSLDPELYIHAFYMPNRDLFERLALPRISCLFI